MNNTESILVLYPAELDSLVPTCIERLPKPSSRDRHNFSYENLDSTYQVDFSQWAHGRINRGIVYSPTEETIVPSFADTDAYETGTEDWKYYYY